MLDLGSFSNTIWSSQTIIIMHNSVGPAKCIWWYSTPQGLKNLHSWFLESNGLFDQVLSEVHPRPLVLMLFVILLLKTRFLYFCIPLNTDTHIFEQNSHIHEAVILVGETEIGQ